MKIKYQDFNKAIGIVKRIFYWGWICFIFYLWIEALFFTPLVPWTWGYTNDKLDAVMILIIATISFQTFFKVYFGKEARS